MPKQLLLLAVMLYCFAGSPFGQQYYFRRLQVENGLSNNTVFCSAQDNNGFLWFGTKDGLNRFDGYSFKVFRNNPQDTTSLGSSYIHSLYIDREGTLWAGTRKGLYRYDAHRENFHLLEPTRDKDVRDIKKDNKGNVWLILGLSLCRYNMLTGAFQYYPGLTNATSLCLPADGTVWVATTSGKIARYNSADEDFAFHDLFHHSKPVRSRWIEKIYESGDHGLLAGTANQGLKLFDRQTGSYRDLFSHNTDNTEIYVRDIVQSGPSEYWIASETGVYVYHADQNRYVNLQKNHNQSYSIADNAIYTLCRDKEGGIWAGSYFGGLSYYPKQYSHFEKFFPGYTAGALQGNVVREICEDHFGQLWIGTEDAGLNKLDRATGRFVHFQPAGKTGDISHSNIHGLLAEGNHLWIGTFEHGLDLMDISTGKVIRHYDASAASGLKSNFIITIYQSHTGQVLLGTGAGVYIYKKQQDHFCQIPGIAENDFIHSLAEDYHGVLWAGAENNGVYRYNPANGRIDNFRYNPADSNSIGSDKINGIFEDHARRLWFATEGGGLCLLNSDNHSFTRYTTANGLPSGFVFRILEDSTHHLWFSTSRGLVCFNPDKKDIRVYNKEDGLLSDQFNYNSAYKDAKGTMYFGSVKGLLSFNPQNFSSNNYPAPLYITGFQVHGHEFDISSPDSAAVLSLLYTNKIVLKHDQSSFSIDFAALSYSAPEKTAYAYLMQGLDRDWTYLKTNRKAYFTELPPGNYVFRVKAAVDGNAFGKETSLAIQVLPPFWLSNTAFILYTVLLAGMVWWMIRSYHRRHEEKNRREIERLEHEKEKELYKAKTDFFTHITHEIKTPLTLIKGPVEDMLAEYGTDPKLGKRLGMVEKNTDRLIELTNQLLDFRQTESSAFSLNFSSTDFSALLAEVYQQLLPVAEQKQLQYTLSIPPAPVIAFIDPEGCRKILVNLLGNATKYARQQVYIRLSCEHKEYFILHVSNDGYIIPADMQKKIFEPFFRIPETHHEKGTGIGLAIARSLAQLHKGSLELAPFNGLRNTFILYLPFSQ